MATNWNRDTFRAGSAGEYDKLDVDLAAQEETESKKERGDGEQESGRGQAILSRAPRPLLGDELYETLRQGRAGSLNQEAPAISPAEDYVTAAEFIALIAEYSAQRQGQDVGANQTPQRSAEATTEAAPSDLSHRHPGSYQSLKAEQATATIEDMPQQSPREDGLLADIVSDETRAEAQADQARQHIHQRSRFDGLSL